MNVKVGYLLCYLLTIISKYFCSTLKVRSSEVVTRMFLFQGQNSADVNGPRWLVKVKMTSCL